MLALSQMAEQINSKFDAGKDRDNNGGGNSTTSSNVTESVDLDNLFAFLSEVTPNGTTNVNALIDEIGEKMENLVEDLDVELESVIQQEIEGLALDRPQPKKIMGVPSLPEPTMPPPPPPMTTTTNTVAPTLNTSNPPANAPLNKIHKANQDPEPIYEAVIPREELPIVPELPEPPRQPPPQPVTTQHPVVIPSATPTVTHHHESQPGHKLRPKSPAVFNARSASPSQRSTGGPISPSSPKHSRPSSRSSSTGPAGLSSHSFSERDQRRKHRVEKKLQEMQQIDLSEREVIRDETYFDLLEFAENNFNVHERTPEGTIMATLTRKGRKSVDMVPKYEMITFYRGNSIQTSHIHMYDPENVSVACNIFRDMNKYLRGELNAEKELQAIQYIIGQGIEREELRDEIFVQCMRQATNNPHSEWLDRIWLLMCLVIVAFQPSKLLFRYFVCFLKKNLESLDGKMRQYVQWCLDNCKCTKVSARTYAPSSVEVAVCFDISRRWWRNRLTNLHSIVLLCRLCVGWERLCVGSFSWTAAPKP